MIKLKSITDKSWLLIADDTHIGVIKQTNSEFQLLSRDTKLTFSDKAEIDEFFNRDIFGCIELSPTAKSQDVEHFIKGYPIKYDSPEEVAIDKLSQIPVFKKRKDSEVYLCAGYFCLHSSNGWRGSFCPKLSTIQNNEHRGPFKTEIEMKQVLNKLKTSDV